MDLDRGGSGAMMRSAWIAAALAAMVLVVFWPATGGEFVSYDDQLYVTENAPVFTGLTPGNIAWAFTTGHAGYWQPVTWLSLMLDGRIWGRDPRGYHLTNLLLHALNSVLLFLVLRGMTGAVWRSALAAALFAVHPLHVESVAWVVERKDVLSTFLGLLAIGVWVRHTRRPGAGMYAAALAAYLLSLMAKPMLVTLPFLLLLLDYWPLGRLKAGAGAAPTGPARWARALIPRGPVREKAPFFLAAAVFSMVAFVTQHRSGATSTLIAHPGTTRIGNALISYARYLGRTLWPRDLAFFYPYPPHGWAFGQVAAAGLVLAAITVAVLLLRRPSVTMGWWWYMGTLVPVIGLVQVGSQAMADRFTYIPLIGVFVAVAWGLGELARAHPRLRTAMALGSLCALAVLMPLARRQVEFWHDSRSLFEHAVKVTPRNWMAHLNLGGYWADRGELKNAAREFAAALEINPDSAVGHNSLGVTLARMGRLDEAMAEFLRALALDPGLAEPYFNLGMALAGQGRFAEAAGYYARGLEIDPARTRARLELADLEALLSGGK